MAYDERAYQRKYQLEWNARNPKKLKTIRRKADHKRRYGITLEERDALLENQGFACAICAADRPGGKGDWHTDHCHETKKVRGVLCHNCNVGLGNFRDNRTFLASAINYLDKA